MEAVHALDARIQQIQARMANPFVARPAVASGSGFGAQLLSAALAPPPVAAPAASGALTPAAVRQPGAYGDLQPPPELAVYGNGRIPEGALVPVGDGHRLEANAAAAFLRMEADAARDGVRLGLTDSYRTYEEQVSLAERKGLYSQGGLAATPGTSNHGWGLAVDLDLDANAQAWMRRNAWQYGFVEDVPREPWHWTYRPAQV
ncbi:MAG: M15 family metallopeptidase [Acidimicrobiales bacterium]|nr:M15 family metallopeptidase [Acidimicrobiales bacterium]